MNYGAQLTNLLEQRGVGVRAIPSETVSELRMDEVSDLGDEFRKDLQLASSYLKEKNLGTIKIIGSISYNEWTPETFTSDRDFEEFTIIINKSSSEDWIYFVTLEGFCNWLGSFSADQISAKTRLCVWVAEEFEPFSTFQHSIKPFHSEKSISKIEQMPERPWKLVRDLTHSYTPATICPWLISEPPASSSNIYDAWSNIAKKNLAFCLPSEIRENESNVEAIFRGGRSLPVPVSDADWNNINYKSFSEACSWVYATPREAETKFQLLNNHLATNWIHGSQWPEGANLILENSLSGAKEAFAFHLQDQSKEAVKGLGDLRKGLQEEVTKTQGAARDLISGIWRDFTIAGIVLALKLPGAPIAVDGKILKSLYLITGLLLLLSAVVSGFSNLRFNKLTDTSRKDWRNKLYSFMSDEDWKKLVESPIEKGKNIFWWTWWLCFVLYISTATYLISLAYPNKITHVINSILFDFLSPIAELVRQSIDCCAG